MATKLVGEYPNLRTEQLKRVGKSKFLAHSRRRLPGLTITEAQPALAEEIEKMRASLGLGGTNGDS